MFVSEFSSAPSFSKAKLLKTIRFVQFFSFNFQKLSWESSPIVIFKISYILLYKIPSKTSFLKIPKIFRKFSKSLNNEIHK